MLRAQPPPARARSGFTNRAPHGPDPALLHQNKLTDPHATQLERQPTVTARGGLGRAEEAQVTQILTLPSWVSRMESLLMSRWMTPWAWSTDKACSTARHTEAICSSFILCGEE